MGQTTQLGEYLKQQFLNGQGVVTQGPGAYPKQLVQKLGGPTMNKGYDIAVPVGTPINTAGMKYLGAKQDRTGYGTRAAYQDPKTGKAIIFSHVSKLENTPEGVRAYTGGRPGIDGRSTGPHLDIDLSGNLNGFSGMLKNVMSQARTSGQKAYKQTQSKLNPQDVLKKAQSIFGGKKVIGVGSSQKSLASAQSKYGGQIVRL